MRVTFLGAILLLCRLAQADDTVYSVGKDVKPPRLLQKKEPEYSDAARQAGVQGMLLLDMVIGEDGRPTSIEVISPLGYGLDERAQQAVSQWRFAPGEKDGKPVKIRSTVEVNFRFAGAWYDSKLEAKRTSFNRAVADLQKRRDSARALETLESLAKQKFPAAMGLIGQLYWRGELVSQDRQRGLPLLEAAAQKHYGPALYELGEIYRKGDPYPANEEKALKLHQEAALLGSTEAQYALGQRYEQGLGVQKDPDRARRYFRLCATTGLAPCQVGLARLLIDSENRREHIYLQALAWSELAADQGSQEGKQIVDRELPRLTEEQRRWVERLKGQLVRRVS